MFETVLIDDIWSCQISDCATAVALFGLLVALPFFMIALTLLCVGKIRTKRVPENIFHRMFDFCETTTLGRCIGGAALFSPTIIIIVASAIVCPADILDAILLGTLPWCIYSLTALLELKYYRKVKSGLNDGPT